MKPELETTRVQLTDANGEVLLLKIEGAGHATTAALLANYCRSAQPSANNLITGLPPSNNEEVLALPSVWDKIEAPAVTNSVDEDGGDGVEQEAEDQGATSNGEEVLAMPTMNFSKRKGQVQDQEDVIGNDGEEVLTMPVMNFSKRKVA